MSRLPAETIVTALIDHQDPTAAQDVENKSDTPTSPTKEGIAATSKDLTQDAGVARIEALCEHSRDATLHHELGPEIADEADVVFGKGWGLYALWISIGLIAYVYSLSRSTTGVYAQFATSAFGEHTIIGTISVINGILAGVLPPFIAKLADIWSRPHTLACAVAMYAIGFAMCAGAKNVNTVVAGQVIYTFGNTGITFMLSLLVADITSLQWRATVNGAINLPYVLNTFVAGYISSGISAYTQNGWRWGYGMFCILLPICISPAIIVLLIGDHRAKKLGVVSLATSSARVRQDAGQDDSYKERTSLQTFRYYWTRLNVFGLLLMGFGFALILTPMTLYSGAKGGWRNPSMIGMEVVGGILFIAWCVWDSFYAEYPFMPRRVFNRSFCACVAVDVFYYSSAYLVETYFSSWVYVIVDWNARDYTFFASAMSATLCFFAIFFGLVIRYTHGYKYVQIFGLCLRIIGYALVYHSTKNPTDAALVMSQILIGLGGAASVIASYIGVQGSVAHQDMAIATAVLNLWSSVGSSITVAISAVVWNNQVPKHLAKYLGSTHNATELAAIFGAITVARTAEPRDLVKQAYMKSVRGLFMAGFILAFGALIAGCFTVNFYLGQNHNIIEQDKIIKFRTDEEIDEEIRKLKDRS